MAKHFSVFDFLVHFPNFNDVVSKFLCLITLCFTLKWTFGSRALSHVTPRIQKEGLCLGGLGVRIEFLWQCANFTCTMENLGNQTAPKG